VQEQLVTIHAGTQGFFDAYATDQLVAVEKWIKNRTQNDNFYRLALQQMGRNPDADTALMNVVCESLL